MVGGCIAIKIALSNMLGDLLGASGWATALVEADKTLLEQLTHV